MKQKRSLKNFLLDPLTQFKISGYFVLMASIFFAGVMYFTYRSWTEVFELMIELSDVQEPARELIATQLKSYLSRLAIFALLFFLTVTAYIIIETHRFLGAAYAIKKYIVEKLLHKDYSEDLIIRKNDHLQDIVGPLNEYIRSQRKSS